MYISKEKTCNTALFHFNLKLKEAQHQRTIPNESSSPTIAATSNPDKGRGILLVDTHFLFSLPLFDLPYSTF